MSYADFYSALPSGFASSFGYFQSIPCGSGGFSCVQRFDPYGAYPDQATCLADVSNQCAEIPPTHDCVSGQCVDPGDGSGEFTGPNSLINKAFSLKRASLNCFLKSTTSLNLGVSPNSLNAVSACCIRGPAVCIPPASLIIVSNCFFKGPVGMT